MPTVLREGGFRLYFYSDEGDPREPPHVHVEEAGGRAKVWIGEVEPRLARGKGLSDRDLAVILRLVATHRALILRTWHGHFG